MANASSISLRCVRRRNGFTLIEMAVSLSIMSVVMLGLGSTVLIATNAANTGSSTNGKTADAGEVVQRITADLQFAKSFIEREQTAITFTVPDRTGDTVDETLRYAWSGIAGDPLTFEYNKSGTSAILLEDVHRLDFGYMLTKVTPAVVSGTEGAEQLLIGHYNAPGASQEDRVISGILWGAQYFHPTLAADAISWKVIRVQLAMARAGRAQSNLTFELRTATPSKTPGATVLASESFSERLLSPVYFWIEWTPDVPVADLDPNTGLCLVVRGDVGPSALVLVETGGTPMTSGAHWLTSADSGNTWSAVGDTDDAAFNVFGTVTVP